MMAMKAVSEGTFPRICPLLLFFLNFILRKTLPVPDCLPVFPANPIVLPGLTFPAATEQAGSSLNSSLSHG